MCLEHIKIYKAVVPRFRFILDCQAFLSGSIYFTYFLPYQSISSEATLCHIIFFWILIYRVITIRIMSNSQELEGLCCELLCLGFVIFLLVLLRKFRLVPQKSSRKMSYCNQQFSVHFLLPYSTLFPIFTFFKNLGAQKKPCTAINIQFILWTPVRILFKQINT